MKKSAPLAFAISILLVLSAVPPACAAALADAARGFMLEIGRPEAARTAILEKIAALPENAKRVVTAEAGGAIYGFSAEPAPLDRDDDVRLTLEVAAQNTNEMRARRALLIYLNQNGLDGKRYRYRDALGDALSSYYGTRRVAGIQTAAGVRDGWVAALVWLAGAVTDIPLAEPPDIEEGYCASLYENEARVLFEAGRYAEALPMFKHLHDHKWANIGAYLDASECFLKNAEPDECLKLLTELISTLGKDMGTDEFTRAGRLFREAGDRTSALTAFKTARERFHEGK
jgi:tetratricopeptide (TPR) repeat protein